MLSTAPYLSLKVMGTSFQLFIVSCILKQKMSTLDCTRILGGFSGSVTCSHAIEDQDQRASQGCLTDANQDRCGQICAISDRLFKPVCALLNFKIRYASFCNRTRSTSWHFDLEFTVYRTDHLNSCSL